MELGTGTRPLLRALLRARIPIDMGAQEEGRAERNGAESMRVAPKCASPKVVFVWWNRATPFHFIFA
jgi:hypothetical protein